MEHLRYFGLADDPFRNEPRTRDFIDTRAARGALKRLERAVRQNRGLAVVGGAIGSGKTMVVRRLFEGLEEEMFEASMLVVLDGASGAGSLLARFARQIGVEAPESERQALLAQLYEQLAITREDGRQSVLIVDDAELLGDWRALSELCALLKLEYEERRLLSLVLVGPATLEQALAAAPALAQRVEVRTRVEPLDAQDCAHYLGQRLRQAGGDPDFVDRQALRALWQLSRGLPGTINRLADNALFEAFLSGRRRLLAEDVERAAADLDGEAAPERPATAADAEEEPGAGMDAHPAGPEASAPDPPRRSEPLPRAEVPARPPASDDPLRDFESELEAIFDDDAAEAALHPMGRRPRGHLAPVPVREPPDDPV